jgi:GNAT superfamily N-acetyltransferase
VGSHPPHVEPIERSELYIELLISSRRHAGRGIGARLVRLARDIAIERGVDVLRVDCWAGAPTLVEWYERQGFTRSGMFDVDGWNGQVFEMPLQTCAK